jgi:CRP-like cAMP-binding protein
MVSRRTQPETLAALAFFQALPRSSLERVARLADEVYFAADECLFREGAVNTRLMVVVHGRVALDMRVPGRGDVRILSLGPGDLVAWSALLGDGRMTTSAVALEATQVVALPAADVRAMCQADSELGYRLLERVAASLANRLVATRLQLLDLFADSPAATSFSAPL